jgi:hypothetical protein
LDHCFPLSDVCARPQRSLKDKGNMGGLQLREDQTRWGGYWLDIRCKGFEHQAGASYLAGSFGCIHVNRPASGDFLPPTRQKPSEKLNSKV